MLTYGLSQLNFCVTTDGRPWVGMVPYEVLPLLQIFMHNNIIGAGKFRKGEGEPGNEASVAPPHTGTKLPLGSPHQLGIKFKSHV